MLDLGSGSGISAIAAAKAGASHVVAADIDLLALAACAVNAAANAVTLYTTDRDMLSAAPPEKASSLSAIFSTSENWPAACCASSTMPRTRDAPSTIGDPRRSYFPEGKFTPLAEYQVPVTRELEDFEIKRTTVWRA
ncbi:50S ribosomal protein L11 methyltransferase [Bradyrhizobium sp. RDI18]|uniref:50S ribosomal protein L11 methyltransferase n=1 Tax=Bradyrhizobium sp. RDI18 TaxID=3367400 RepID=UPI003722CDFE